MCSYPLHFFWYLIESVLGRCSQIHDWEQIPNDELRGKNPNGLYDSPHRRSRRRVDLEQFDLLSDNGLEKPIFSSDGKRVRRRHPIVDLNEPPCGVLMDLTNIQALFNPNPVLDLSDDISISSTPLDSPAIQLDAYPLGFLRTAGNIQAKSVPYCFYPVLTEINNAVRRPVPHNLRAGHFEEYEEDDEAMSVDDAISINTDIDDGCPRFPVVKPISCQFYNLMTHRVASRAGRHDAQQGTVTAAISGAFAKSPKDRLTASKKQSYCDRNLPSERFHKRISIDSCPTSCRAELVYSVDVRALKDPSGAYVFVSVMSFSIILTFMQNDIQRHHHASGTLVE